MITQEFLHRLFFYEAETGWFYYRESRGSARKGAAAGWNNGIGYWKISINGTMYYAHRLAWLYVYGELPSVEVDHIDGNVLNNAISNLRLATSSENSCNAEYAVGVSGLRGVYPNDRGGLPWRAIIQVGRRQIWLGTYASKEEASQAYVAAAKLHHGEFAYHNRPPQRRI